MSEAPEIFAAAAELSAQGRPFVLMTVIRTEGSTPRKAGARMLWEPGKSSALGTVGGGQFEHLVMESAARHAAKKTCGTERFVLGAEAEQCCGGVMDVFYEYHGPRRRLVVFGAGHVSLELARLVEGAGLEVVIVDDRAEWNSAERFGHARRVGTWDEGVGIAQEQAGATMACVMTCSHETDFEVLRALLRKAPGFVGLIGSRSKRVCLFGRLVASGLDESVVQRVQCPVGVGDTGKTPRLVAISIAARVLLEAKNLECLG